MTLLPFICLGIGILLGIYVKAKAFTKIVDTISTVALAFLMLSIGVGIGLDREVVSQLATIGFQCAVISLSAIGFSALFTLLCEKTVLPLSKVDFELQEKKLELHLADIKPPSDNNEIPKADRDVNFVWIMPVSLLLGLGMGIIARAWLSSVFVDRIFVFFLIVLYVCVGISQGSNREVLKYLKTLGFKILWLPLAILVGSLAGGFISGIILCLPQSISMVAAGGMSFYSITGAFMTSAYGLRIGAYGFLVNVMREFFTILLMPLLIKISLGSPIAGGAAGNMDTMLAPVTKFVGVRLGLVTLITGTILTFIVPFLLPILATVLNGIRL